MTLDELLDAFRAELPGWEVWLTPNTGLLSPERAIAARRQVGDQFYGQAFQIEGYRPTRTEWRWRWHPADWTDEDELEDSDPPTESGSPGEERPVVGQLGMWVWQETGVDHEHWSILDRPNLAQWVRDVTTSLHEA